jgi:DNA-binding winged helix-turn-helix (wHTH) protein/predicted ATPase
MPANTPTFPPFRLDPANACLWRGTKRIALPPKDFAVLHYLVIHAGQLVTHAELLKAVWPDAVVSPKGLKAFVRRLRQVLSDHAAKPRFIETVHRRGYRFIAPLTTPPHSRLESRVQSLGSEGHRAVLSIQTPDPRRQTLDVPLVGRESELERLHGWLGKALNRERQMVFVTGEPGIGKTTIVEAFLARVAAKEKVWIGRGQCIEQYGAGEPYLPVRDALGRMCQGPAGASFVPVLRQHAPLWLLQMPSLLSDREVEELQRRTIGATREWMLREFAEALEVLTSERALILVLEDLHWADVSTLELLAMLARRPEPARVFVIGTYRPMELLGNNHPLNSVVHELYAHGLGTEVALGLLNEADVVTYLQQRFPRSVFPTRLAQVLYRRTEGNPLFFVSVLEDLVTQGVIRQGDEDYLFQGNMESLVTRVPESIRHLVTRQRERLTSDEQQVLKAASIAGTEFSVAAVAAALEREVVAAGERCARLAERQQFLRPAGVAEWPDGTVAARYGFVHALYQHLWHEQVSTEQQQQWHLRIGRRKEMAYGQRASEIAAELAVHFEQGRDYPKAVQYLQHAADNALRCSAAREAIEQVSKGLQLLRVLPKTAARVQQELTLQMTLSGALRMSRGFAAPEVADAYARARGLCRQVKATPQLFSVLWGLSSFYVARADVQSACEIGEQLLSLAGRMQDTALLIEACMRLGLPLYLRGEFVRALGYLEQGLKLYDGQQHRALALRYGQDPGVTGFGYAAIVLWCLGYPERARERVAEGLRLAQELDHPSTLAYALYIAASHCVLRREVSATKKYAEALMTLATEREFPHWLTRGAVYRGWALAVQGQLDEGISEMRGGITASRKMGAEIWQPYFRALLADLYSEKGQPEIGIALVIEALSMMDRTRERIAESELYRLKGELVLQSAVHSLQSGTPSTQHPTPSTQSEAEASFQKAIKIARQQSAKSFELRAVVSLSRLWQRQGKKEEARQMLAEIYGWFTEGFDTADLQEARAVLEELEEHTTVAPSEERRGTKRQSVHVAQRRGESV